MTTELHEDTPSSAPKWRVERRDRIVRAALELLDDSTYEKVQMRDVALRSGFALGTVYRYFKSKEHLYAAVMVEWARSFQRRVDRKALVGPPPERLKQVVLRVIQAFEHKPQFVALEHLLETTVDPDAQREFNEVSDRHLETFVKVLAPLPDELAWTIVKVVTDVIAVELNQYRLGKVPMKGVEDAALATIDLIFGPSPWPEDGIVS